MKALEGIRESKLITEEKKGAIKAANGKDHIPFRTMIDGVRFV
jgi:hypothetical protein